MLYLFFLYLILHNSLLNFRVGGLPKRQCDGRSVGTCCDLFQSVGVAAVSLILLILQTFLCPLTCLFLSHFSDQLMCIVMLYFEILSLKIILFFLNFIIIVSIFFGCGGGGLFLLTSRKSFPTFPVLTDYQLPAEQEEKSVPGVKSVFEQHISHKTQEFSHT